MKALVTGGAGFLGSHLCDRLIADGNDVLCVDNLYTGSLDNVRQLLGGTGFNFLNHDVTSPLDAEVERIFNLACPASPIHYQRNPIETTRTCVHGAINMLDLATRAAGPHPAGIDLGGVWGSRNSSAIRGLLGTGQSDRTAQLL